MIVFTVGLLSLFEPPQALPEVNILCFGSAVFLIPIDTCSLTTHSKQLERLNLFDLFLSSTRLNKVNILTP